jgi:Pregnancy-associated plasma protein-A
MDRNRRPRRRAALCCHLSLLASLICACPFDPPTNWQGQGEHDTDASIHFVPRGVPSSVEDALLPLDQHTDAQARRIREQQGIRRSLGQHHTKDRVKGLRLCGAKHPTRKDRIRLALAYAKYDSENPVDEDENGQYIFQALAGNGTKQASSKVSFVIPVRFNVFLKNNTLGRLSLTQLQSSLMAATRKAFNGTGFQFQVKSVRHFVNPTWAICNDPETFKRRTHVGGPETLNVWICDLASKRLAGTALYPPIVASDPKIDGVTLMNPALGGADYAMQAFVHELGHWFGLLHTFSGGCSPTPFYNVGRYPDYYFSGDGVKDTPAQRRPTWEFPQQSYCWRNDSLDTCANRNGVDAGRDPVDNYMNYLPGECFRDYGRFTPGQRKRMRAQWLKWRNPKTRSFR